MQATVLEASRDQRLVTPARLAFLAKNMPSQSSLSELVDQQYYIDIASSRITSAIGRELWRQQYQEWLAGTGRKHLYTTQRPLEAEGFKIRSSFSSLALPDFRLADDRWAVYRLGEWHQLQNPGVVNFRPINQTEAWDFDLTFFAGYLMPGQVDDWKSNIDYELNESTSYQTTVTQGSWVRPTDLSNLLRFEATVAGTSDATEPVWPVINPWGPERTYATGEYVVARDEGPIDLWFQATTGGDSGNLEPAWPVDAGETVTDGEINVITWTSFATVEVIDGSVTWTGHFAEELPDHISHFAAFLAMELVQGKCGKDEMSKNSSKAIRGALRSA